MRPVARLRVVINNLYSKHLLVTNIATCGSLLGLGDLVVQKIGHLRGNSEPVWDWARTGRMVTIGFTLGPFNHYWYFFLDKIVKRQGIQGVLQKIMYDQFVAGPFFCTTFLVGSSLLEGGRVKGATEEWKKKFLSIYLVDWAFWPAAQFINFRLVPSRYRVLYVSFATLVWNSFLSFMKHDHQAHNSVKVPSKVQTKKEKVL